MRKHKTIFISTLLLCSLFICILTAVKKERLDNKEIQVLRSEYKIVYTYTPNQLDSADRSNAGVRRIVEKADTFAYCEVIGTPLLRKIFIGTGDAGLDKEAFGDIEYNATQYYFPVRVISDTEGFFESGDEIFYCYGVIYQDYDPQMKVGGKIIIPIFLSGAGSKGQFFSNIEGYYYVTDDGYVMSAFAESGDRYSGLRYDILMEKLVKTEEERTLYSELKKLEYEWSSGEYGFIDIESFRNKVKNELIPINKTLVTD